MKVVNLYEVIESRHKKELNRKLDLEACAIALKECLFFLEVGKLEETKEAREVILKTLEKMDRI